MITKLAIDQLEHKLETDKAARGRLSYSIRSNTSAKYPLEVADNVTELLTTFLPSAAQQIDNLLLIVSQEAGENRAAKIKHNDVAWSAKIGTVEADDVGYVILEAQKKELVRISGGVDELQLTATGWERVQFLAAPQVMTVAAASPAPTSRVRPVWLEKITDQALRDVLNEVYRALDQSYLLLPLMGARTAFDRAMFLFVGDPSGGFQGKLNAMKIKGKVTDREIGILQPMIDAGNATAHRGWAPTPQVVSSVMDEVEHMLRDWFERDSAAAAVRAIIPKRT